MNANVPEIVPPQGARLQEVIAGSPGVAANLRRAAVFLGKLVTGAFFCGGMFGILGGFSFIGAILVVGWTCRLMQRSALKIWWQHSPAWYSGVRFETLTSTGGELRTHLRWPDWLRGERWYSSLVQNFKLGLAAVFNSYVLTVIPGLIWFLTWGAGWDNSFNFGYEQTFVNPSRYVVGMSMFVVVMFYLPMAQARQAVTGDWRSFYHFRCVREIIRRRWLACLVLAGLYALLSLPVMALSRIPYFIGQKDEAFLDLSAIEHLRILLRYQFAASLFVFPAFVFLRLAAARCYATGVRDALQDGGLVPVGFERIGVEKLHIDVPDPRPERSVPTRFILWAGSFSGRVTAGLLAVLIWFAFTFQIVVGQFFKYESNPLKGWINQPLVQMPWFDLVPTPLMEAVREERRASSDRG